MMKKYISTVLTIFTIGLASNNSFAHDMKQVDQVSVSGECNHMVSPDRGSIVLTVQFQDMNISKATRDAAQSYERLSTAVKKLRLKDFNMRTSEYSVREITAWENKRQVKKGFQARMGLWVSTSEIQRMGEVIAAASKERVKDVHSLRTYLSDEKQLKEEMSCLEEAAKNAQAKAKKLASAVGANIGKVLTMNESGRRLPHWPNHMMHKTYARSGSMAMDMAESAPQVEAGQQNLSLTVNATFALK